MERVATLGEIRACWTILDVFDANDALDVMAEAKAKAEKDAAAKRT